MSPLAESGVGQYGNEEIAEARRILHDYVDKMRKLISTADDVLSSPCKGCPECAASISTLTTGLSLALNYTAAISQVNAALLANDFGRAREVLGETAAHLAKRAKDHGRDQLAIRRHETLVWMDQQTRRGG